MKILIGNPPWRMGNRLGVRAGSRWPFIMEVPEGTRIPPYAPFPFFFAYAADVLERERIPVMLIDGIAEGLTEEEYLAKAAAKSATTGDIQKVSLYIPCYNAAKTLDECLRGVMGQSYPIDEILVIDDGSSDETAAVASRYPVKIIRHPKNLGVAASRNTAFRAARNELVAAVDADVVLDKDWLKTLIGYFDTQDIAGACGRLVERHQSALPDAWRARHMPQHWGEEKIRNPYFLFGADNIYRKSVIIEIGMYNEVFRTNFEDVDMGIRMAKAGKQIIYDPTAVAYHLKRDTTISVLRAYYLWYSPNYPSPVSAAALMHRFRVYFGDLLRMLKKDGGPDKIPFLIIDIMLWMHRSFIDAKKYARNMAFPKKQPIMNK